jgi:glycine dehydrogenase subunit 1
MLSEIGMDSVEDLFRSIPDELRFDRALDLPPAHTEPELLSYFKRLASSNLKHKVAFLGAGVYPHYIPAVVDDLISRSEFYTAYTPYQPEIAQGTLQAIFEFQTYMTQLTGMDAANASLYDGSTALAEAVLMAHRITGRKRVIVARSIHPEYRAVLATYCRRLGLEPDSLGILESGQFDAEDLASKLTPDVAAVLVQTPNFFGTIEPVDRMAEMAHRAGALAIVAIPEAMSMGILKAPGAHPTDCGRADIVVGEAQSFGVPMSFGGPHIGFIATREEHVRQLPGRLVGMGHDRDGRRAFVLTLAAREQHIRRERATSNICTNQSLCALMSTIYLALVGPEGLREVAIENMQKAAWVRDRIEKETPHEVVFNGPCFNEFVVRIKGFDKVWSRMLSDGTVAGLPLRDFYPELPDSLLICVTETHSVEDVDRLIDGLRGLGGHGGQAS